MVRKIFFLLALPITGILTQPAIAQQTNKKTTHKKAPQHKTEETIVINESGNGKVEVEFKEGNLYINGELQSEIKDPKNEDHKIVINLKGEPEQDHQKKEVIIKQMDRGNVNQKALLGVYTASSDFGGVLITGIMPHSAAEKAGIKAGDVIHQIDGHNVNSPGELSNVIKSYHVGDNVLVSLNRESDYIRLNAILTAAEDETTEADEVIDPMTGKTLLNIPFGGGKGIMLYDQEPPKLGITARDAPTQRGIEVVGVKNSSPAEKAGIQVGDIIMRLDHERVYRVNDIQAALNTADVSRSIKVDFRRNGELMSADVDLSGNTTQKDL